MERAAGKAANHVNPLLIHESPASVVAYRGGRAIEAHERHLLRLAHVEQHEWTAGIDQVLELARGELRRKWHARSVA